MQVYSSMVGSSDKITHAPLDFERYDQVTSTMPVQPASINNLTEDERALLASNISSEQKPRRAEHSDNRQNGRREARPNGTRDNKRHEVPRRNADDAQSRNPNPIHNNAHERNVEEKESIQPSARTQGTQVEGASQPNGRNVSRLSTMGVFDTGVDHDAASKWKEEKDEDVLKEAMGYADTSKQDVDRLTEMYQHQSLSSNPTQNSRGYGEQAYNPLSNGLPDLFSKGPNSAGPFQNPSQHQNQPRGGFMESAPSPGLPMRQEQPMTARVMVMPDKLKWQYRDPTGQNQGPFSGLEMHDWYKAGFFQPNLLVKREEDEDFEPLSILVRRIGNQREPFLVPLPSRVTAATQPTRPGSQDDKDQWPNGQNWSGAGQPPFPQSFPSFGTTLTAEQQNALERRKQEEQYLMHRQREFLQQQQMAQQMAAQRLLHHQHPYGGHGNSSFGYGGGDRRGSPFSSGSERQGSMNSFDMGGAGGGGGQTHSGWGGYAPQNQNAHRGQYTDFGAGIFDTPKSEVADNIFREPEQVAEKSNDSHKLTTNKQHEQQPAQGAQKFQQTDYASRMAQQAQAQQAQAQMRQAEAAKRQINNHASQSQGVTASAQPSEAPELLSDHKPVQPVAETSEATVSQSARSLSVEEQQSTIAATATPTTPSAAPWAAASSSKGKSLKEIQEIEATRDAQRRQAERNAAREAQAQVDLLTAQAPLPVSVPLNWAADASADVTGSPALGAAWKPATTPGKKTLAQIQQEEESARRAKIAQQAKTLAQAQVPGGKPVTALGTKYADTAGKPSATWSTVGTGGKISAPTPPRVEPKVQSNMPSNAVKPTFAPTPAQQPAVSRPADPNAISPEFLSWARSALKGLNPGVNFVEFLQLLLSFGTDGGKDTREIISDSIYANSATMDGRRFADEWSKRRKEDLKNTNGQNKSISELTSTLAASSASSNSNGWSDVVKTKPGKQDTEEEWNSSFKVQAKKGGGKRK